MSGRKRAQQLQFSLPGEPEPVRGGAFVKALRLKREEVPSFRRYPFSMPAVRKLSRLEFHPAVTFFIGENGSGKSTLLEALALKCGFNPEGGAKTIYFATHDTHSELHRFLVVERGVPRPSDGYFLRAESFYNVATNVEAIEKEFPQPEPFSSYGGKSLHVQSHGEAFLSLLLHRLKGDGLYLFDEPESALSPQRQLSVLTLMDRLVRRHSQLIIATHSPILLAYPHARIYEFTSRGIVPVAYTDTEHFQVTRTFLQRHERMLEMLLDHEKTDPQ
jgi:predicted ATPase